MDKFTSVINQAEELLKSVEKDEQSLTDTVQELEQLRRHIAVLENRRIKLKTQIKEQRPRLQSLQRALELEEEQRRVTAELAVSKETYQAILDSLSFPLDPYDHQVNGAIKLAVARRGMCADKRGLGKTLTAIIWKHLVGSKKTLIMAPSKLLGQMERELRYWDADNDSAVLNMSGYLKHERDMVYPMIERADEITVLVNYESWRRDKSVVLHLLNCGFDAAIMDEIHNAKESNKLVAKGLKEISGSIEKILQMTGTPILNRPQEIWSPLHMLYPKIFPTEKAFLNDYCMGWGSDWYWRTGGQEALAEKIAAFYVARSRESAGVIVPPPAIIEYPLTLDNYPEQKDAYQLLSERAILALKSEKVHNLPSVLAILTRQRQMVSWPAGIEFNERNDEGNIVGHYKFDVHESVKIDFAKDLIDELVDEGERVVLFSNYKEPVYELSRRLNSSHQVAVYTGETSQWERDSIEEDFDLKTAPKNPRYKVLLATYKTVAEGLNLNGARHAILLDREWNPGREEQATGRIDRLNSVDQATIHIPEVSHTVDKFIRDLIERKHKIITGFNDATAIATALIENLEDQ